MNKEKKATLNRRNFLGLSALGLTGLTILPSWRMPNGVRIPPSDRVVMGFIGLGRQGLGDYSNFTKSPGVQVVAGSDVDTNKRERFKRRVEAWQKSQNVAQRCDTYESYEELLDRKDIDAVSIASPDHWHALHTIHASQAMKDVYVQKPLAYTIQEGIKMVRSIRDNGRVLQVGSQQRSGREFQRAIELVRKGAIGHIETIFASVGDPPKPFDLPQMPVPAGLNWNLWLGPLNNPKIHYHPELAPPISLSPEVNEKNWGAWRWYQETGNGYTSDWGAHMFDIAQAAIGMDGVGPIEYTPKGYKGAKYNTMTYANGIVMTEQDFREEGGKGIRFNGTKGWIKVARGYIECSDPSLVSKPAAIDPAAPAPHMQDFIDTVRSRGNTIAPVEAGCSTNTLCCLVNIALELGRPVKWDPVTLSFGNDKEAANHRLNQYEYRRPYTL
jgi:predicted dehydrogenase